MAHVETKTLLTKLPDRSHKIRQPTQQDKDTDHDAIAGNKKGDQKGLETADRRRKGVPGSVPDTCTWRNRWNSIEGFLLAAVNVAGFFNTVPSVSPGASVGDATWDAVSLSVICFKPFLVTPFVACDRVMVSVFVL